jgi:hypothetical protein
MLGNILSSRSMPTTRIASRPGSIEFGQCMIFLIEKFELGYENMSSFGSSMRVAKEKEREIERGE